MLFGMISKTHFQDNLVFSFFLFGLLVKICRYILTGFPKGNRDMMYASDPGFQESVRF